MRVSALNKHDVGQNSNQLSSEDKNREVRRYHDHDRCVIEDLKGNCR